MDNKNIFKRGNIYYCRKTVPSSLVEIIGKDKLIKSLKTGDLRTANQRKLHVLSEFQKLLDEAKAQEFLEEKLSDNTPDDPHEAFANYLIEATKLSLASEHANPDHIEAGIDAMFDSYTSKNNLEHPDSPSPEVLVRGLATSYKILQGVHLLSELIQVYLKEEEPAIGKQTLSEKTRHLNQFKTYLKTDLAITDVTKEIMRDYLNREITPLDKSSVTKGKMFNNVKNFFTWAVIRGHIDSNPAESLKGTFKNKKKKAEDIRTTWEDKEIKSLLDANTDKRLEALILIAMYTGSRVNEICNLKASDVVDDCFYIYDSKTENSTRTVPIHSEIQELVLNLQQESTDGYLLSELGSGGRYNRRSHSIAKKFGRLKTQLGFNKTKVFHSFRKTVVTKLDRANVDIHTVKALIGHVDGDLTFGTYSAGKNIDQLKEAIELVKYDLN